MSVILAAILKYGCYPILQIRKLRFREVKRTCPRLPKDGQYGLPGSPVTAPVLSTEKELRCTCCLLQGPRSSPDVTRGKRPSDGGEGAIRRRVLAAELQAEPGLSRGCPLRRLPGGGTPQAVRGGG